MQCFSVCLTESITFPLSPSPFLTFFFWTKLVWCWIEFYYKELSSLDRIVLHRTGRPGVPLGNCVFPGYSDNFQWSWYWCESTLIICLASHVLHLTRKELSININLNYHMNCHPHSFFPSFPLPLSFLLFLPFYFFKFLSFFSFVNIQ